MLAEAAMDVGADMVGMVKTNTKWFYTDTLEYLTKDFPRGSYFVLNIKSMVPRGRALITISWKYNVQKVISFVAKEYEGRTKAVITHLSKYPGLFSFFSALKKVVVAKNKCKRPRKSLH